MKKLLFLILLISLSFPLNCIINSNNKFIDGMNSLLGAVLLLNIVLIVLAYIFGTSFRIANFLVFSKDELFQLFLSLFLVISLYGILSFSCVTGEYFKQVLFNELSLPSEYYTPDMELVDVAKNFLGIIKGESTALLKNYAKSSINKEMFSTWVWTIYTFGGETITTATEAYKKTYALQYDTLISMFLNPILLSVNMQRLVLNFFLEFAIPVFFPLGILFRAFPPTRQLGDMVIAFAIGSYVLLPLLYAFNAAMYYSTMTKSDCGEFSEAINDQVLGGCSSTGSFWDIGKMIPQAFFLPNLTIAIFITFLAAVHRALRVFS